CPGSWPMPPFWRRAATSTKDNGDARVSEGAKTTNPPASRPADVDQLRQLVERAKKGDATALPALRVLLLDPGIVDKLNGDLARVAQQSLVNAAAGNDLAFREAVLRKLEMLRAELAGPDPTPIERLLVERVVACWLQVHHADVLYVQGQAKFTIV